MIIDEEKKKKKNIILLIIVGIVIIGCSCALLFFSMNKPEKIFKKFINYSANKLEPFYLDENMLKDSFKSSTKINIERNGKKYDEVTLNVDGNINEKKKQIKLLSEIINGKDSLIKLYLYGDKNSLTFKFDEIYDKSVVYSYGDINKYWEYYNNMISFKDIITTITNSYVKHYKDDIDIIKDKKVLTINNEHKVKSYTLSYNKDDAYNLIVNILNDLNNDSKIKDILKDGLGDQEYINNIIKGLNKDDIGNIELTIYTSGLTNKINGFDFVYGDYIFSNYEIKGEKFIRFNDYSYLGNISNEVNGKLYNKDKEVGNLSYLIDTNIKKVEFRDNNTNVNINVSINNDNIDGDFNYKDNNLDVNINSNIEIGVKPKFPGISNKINYKDIQNKDELFNKAASVISKSSLYILFNDIGNDISSEKELNDFRTIISENVSIIEKEVNSKYHNTNGCFNVDTLLGNDLYGFVKIIKVNDKYKAFLTVGKDNFVIENYSLDDIKNNSYVVTSKKENFKYSC